MIYFQHQKPVEMERGGFFIPLCDNPLCEKGPMELKELRRYYEELGEGFYDEIKPAFLVMNSGSAALFIAPKHPEAQPTH